MVKNLAVFDYDNTLIRGDSLWPYLCFAAGRMFSTFTLVRAVLAYGWRRLRGHTRQSMRTYVKAALLRDLLGGRRRVHLGEAARRTRRWQKVDAGIMQKLRDHHARGDMIVIASGALDLYLTELLRGVPYDALLCTEVGVDRGIVTGDMTKGNCVRSNKAQRLAAWLAENGPFGETFGYGNYPHDVPMLDLLRYRIIVS